MNMFQDQELSVLQSAEKTIAKKARHALSSSISFLDTAAKNLSGPNPDREKALRIHAMGMEKLRSVIQDLDSILESSPERSFNPLSIGIFVRPEMGDKHEIR